MNLSYVKTSLLCGAVVACATSFASEARGADPSATPTSPEDQTTDPKKEKAPETKAEKKKAKAEAAKAKGAEKLTVGARVFVRETVKSEGGGPWGGELDLESARLRVRYDWERLRAEVEVEAAASGGARLRDAYVRLDLPERFELLVGNFKTPISPIENESTWSLPTVGRGLLSDVFDDSFHLTGRRPGIMASWSAPKDVPVRPRFELAAFQAENLVGDSVPGRTEDALGADPVARAAVAWRLGDTGKLEFGVAGTYRLLQDSVVTPPSRHWGASIDAQLDHTFCGQGVRVWAEGFVGQNSLALDTTPTTPEEPTFVAGRLLAAWRRGGVDKDEWFIEPFVLASALDANLDNAKDGVFEVAGGVAGGVWKRWRLQAQLQIWRESSLTHPSLQADGADLVDREAVLVQLGAAF